MKEKNPFNDEQVSAKVNHSLLTYLKKYIKDFGITFTAVKLGYKSTSSISKWVASGKLPPKACWAIQQKLKGNKIS